MSGNITYTNGGVSIASTGAPPVTVPVVADYLALVPSQHATQPRFNAMLSLFVQAMVDVQNVLAQIETLFDLDTAEGAQLDILGIWIGRSRHIAVPITNLYFSFDTAGLGFDQGVWYSPFDPVTETTDLDDDTYRCLLKAKVILNKWDGTKAVLYTVLDAMFLTSPGTTYTIVDNQDMTMTITLGGVEPPPVLLAVFTSSVLPLAPSTVGLTLSTPW